MSDEIEYRWDVAKYGRTTHLRAYQPGAEYASEALCGVQPVAWHTRRGNTSGRREGNVIRPMHGRAHKACEAALEKRLAQP